MAEHAVVKCNYMFLTKKSEFINKLHWYSNLLTFIYKSIKGFFPPFFHPWHIDVTESLNKDVTESLNNGVGAPPAANAKARD